MSNLNSVFDTLRGWPDGSALEASFEPDTGATVTEGTIVSVASRQLAPAKVLRMVNDALVTAPTLPSSGRGKAYVVAGVGGAWSTFAIGDIVEWNGTAWTQIVLNSAAEPPLGTRIVAVEASAAGSFVGGEEKIFVYTAGKPNAWVAAPAPINGNRIKIVGANSVYENKFYDYAGTHPSGAWGKAARQIEAPALLQTLSSGIKTSTTKPHAWIVIQGNDQFDGRFTNKVTCIKCSSGAVLKLATTIANTLAPGDSVCAVSGVLTKLTSGAGMQWPIGQVIYSNGVTGTGGIVNVATY